VDRPATLEAVAALEQRLPGQISSLRRAGWRPRAALRCCLANVPPAPQPGLAEATEAAVASWMATSAGRSSTPQWGVRFWGRPGLGGALRDLYRRGDGLIPLARFSLAMDWRLPRRGWDSTAGSPRPESQDPAPPTGCPSTTALAGCCWPRVLSARSPESLVYGLGPIGGSFQWLYRKRGCSRTEMGRPPPRGGSCRTTCAGWR